MTPRVAGCFDLRRSVLLRLLVVERESASDLLAAVQEEWEQGPGVLDRALVDYVLGSLSEGGFAAREAGRLWTLTPKGYERALEIDEQVRRASVAAAAMLGGL